MDTLPSLYRPKYSDSPQPPLTEYGPFDPDVLASHVGHIETNQELVHYSEEDDTEAGTRARPGGEEEHQNAWMEDAGCGREKESEGVSKKINPEVRRQKEMSLEEASARESRRIHHGRLVSAPKATAEMKQPGTLLEEGGLPRPVTSPTGPEDGVPREGKGGALLNACVMYIRNIQ
ncbi:hypothetical protein NDU88_001066 [Pleurodeles waltl]|uniref:Uncharacterized protein n=1 Tax=Pleurodeles waltl TaxID=8319 RepID=A0AAV7NJ11_PLEWA|nr:hypothetical protein NDU88_001066 [Pleurodeles waltl]